MSGADARAKLPEVRNPLIKLEAARKIMLLPPDTRRELAGLLRELAAEANEKAQYCWRKHKAPMAAYWKAVAVYARHTARLLAAKQGS